MAEKHTKIKDFLEKIRFKYRLAVINEDTLEEVRYFRLSRLSLFVLASSLAVIYFVIISLVIIFTPLRNYLPQTDTRTRSELINNAIRLDSLATQVEIQTRYLDVVRGVITGDIKIDSIMPIDSIVRIHTENISLERSEREAEFIKNHNAKR